MDHLLVFATFLVALGLTARLTRLAVDDAITQPIRNRIANFSFALDATGKRTVPQKAALWVSEMLNCQWCSGMWVATGVTTTAVLATDLSLSPFYFVAWVATLSYLTGVLSTLVYKWEDED